MSKPRLPIPVNFPILLTEIKSRIQQAQTRAMLSVNVELVRLYWDVGQMLDARQSQQGWGAAVIPRLSRELQNELPEIKGFSERNIDRMVAFYRAYPRPTDFSPQAVAKLATPEKVQQAVAKSDVAIRAVITVDVFLACNWQFVNPTCVNHPIEIEVFPEGGCAHIQHAAPVCPNRIDCALVITRLRPRFQHVIAIECREAFGAVNGQHVAVKC